MSWPSKRKWRAALRILSPDRSCSTLLWPLGTNICELREDMRPTIALFEHFISSKIMNLSENSNIINFITISHCWLENFSILTGFRIYLHGNYIYSLKLKRRSLSYRSFSYSGDLISVPCRNNDVLYEMCHRWSGWRIWF